MFSNEDGIDTYFSVSQSASSIHIPCESAAVFTFDLSESVDFCPAMDSSIPNDTNDDSEEACDSEY